MRRYTKSPSLNSYLPLVSVNVLLHVSLGRNKMLLQLFQGGIHFFEMFIYYKKLGRLLCVRREIRRFPTIDDLKKDRTSRSVEICIKLKFLPM